MYISLMKLITDVCNAALLTVFRSSAIKNKKRISKIKESYKILIFILKCDDSSLRTLIVVICSVKKLYIQQMNIYEILQLQRAAISLS